MTSTTTSSDIVAIGTDDAGYGVFADLSLSTGTLAVYGEEGPIGLGATSVLQLLDALRTHEDAIRQAASVVEDRQRWDAAYAIARDLIGQGARVLSIGPDHAPADNEHGKDYNRPVLAVQVSGVDHVLGMAADASQLIKTKGSGQGYTHYCVEPVPGVVVTAVQRDETQAVPA